MELVSKLKKPIPVYAFLIVITLLLLSTPIYAQFFLAKTIHAIEVRKYEVTNEVEVIDTSLKVKFDRLHSEVEAKGVPKKTYKWHLEIQWKGEIGGWGILCELDGEWKAEADGTLIVRVTTPVTVDDLKTLCKKIGNYTLYVTWIFYE